MDFAQYISLAVDFVLHLDEYLAMIIGQFGLWTYLILFLVIFMETGFVVTPFLPGDSLLFAAGAIAAASKLNPVMMFFILAGAAILGDTVNYWIGHYIGPRVFSGKVRFLKKEYLDRTHAFYEKHGGKTIFLARFIPIIRTFAPFVAGVGKMSYGYFLSYNVLGGLVWTALFISAGYYFGSLPFVKENFSLVIIAIVVISVLPAVYEYLKEKRKGPQESSKVPASSAEEIQS